MFDFNTESAIGLPENAAINIVVKIFDFNTESGLPNNVKTCIIIIIRTISELFEFISATIILDNAATTIFRVVCLKMNHRYSKMLKYF